MVEHRVGQNTNEWYEARAKNNRLTASRFGVICGVSKYALPSSLYDLLTDRMVGEEKGETDITRHGHTTEGISRTMYERSREKVILDGHFWTHAAYDWLGASPDGVICDPIRLINKPPEPYCCAIGLWENKSPIYKVYDEISLEHMCQIQGQLEICREYGDRSLKYDWCDYTVFFENEIQRLYRVYRSQEFWNWMFPRLSEFHNALIERPEKLTLSNIGEPPQCRIERLI